MAKKQVVDVDVYFIQDSEKAIQVTDGSTFWTGGSNGRGYEMVNRYWLPKSQIEYELRGAWRHETKEKIRVCDVIVTLPTWLCEEKRLDGSVV